MNDNSMTDDANGAPEAANDAARTADESIQNETQSQELSPRDAETPETEIHESAAHDAAESAESQQEESPSATAVAEPAADIERGDSGQERGDSGRIASSHSEASPAASEDDNSDTIVVKSAYKPAKATKSKSRTKPKVSKTIEPEPTSFGTASLEGEPVTRHWYILKVATNREDSICDSLKRKVAMTGLDRYFGEIIVPVELITEFKNGKRRTTKRKLYPGYIVVNMEINDDTWYVIRETAGIGDFTGAMGRPTPMSASDIEKILPKSDESPTEQPKVAIKYKAGDKVRIKEGNFINFEGNIEAVDESKGRVTVMVNIFGRPTPVDIEFWLVETVDL